LSFSQPAKHPDSQTLHKAGSQAASQPTLADTQYTLSPCLCDHQPQPTAFSSPQKPLLLFHLQAQEVHQGATSNITTAAAAGAAVSTATPSHAHQHTSHPPAVY
jgi:hypothetical protein